MKVAYVCCDPGVPVFGCKGCSIHVQEVLRELSRRGAEIDLFAMRIGGECPPDLSNVRVHKIECEKATNQADREQFLNRSNETVADMLTRAAPFNIVYERYSLYSFSAMEYARNWLIPGILEVNSPLVEEQAQYRELIDRDLAEQTTRRVMTMAGAVIAVSQEVADFVEQQRLYPSGIHVLSNGVDVSRFQIDGPEQFPKKENELAVGFVGTLKPWHGVADLIEAFRILSVEEPRARLTIVGAGPERGRLEHQVACLPASVAQAVRFTGAVSPDRIPGLLSQMDVAVAPFKASEGFYFSPLKIFEYMAAGLPTVASELGQIPDILEDGVTGLLAPPDDPQQLAETILLLLRDPEKTKSMGRAARAIAENQFTWETVVSQILKIAKRLKRKMAPRLSTHTSRFVNNFPKHPAH